MCDNEQRLFQYSIAKYKSYRYLAILFLRIIIIFICVAGLSPAWGAKGVYDWAYVALDCARQEKVAALQRFCDRIHALALSAAEDPFVKGCFEISQQYALARSNGLAPVTLDEKIQELEQSFTVYFAENYFAFHDILFISCQGNILHSVRKECMSGENLFSGGLAHSALAQCLKEKPSSERFVDYAHYTPSAEAAAFFIEPVFHEDSLQGWIVLQCAINKLNTIFAWIESLGQTGETFLVNVQGLMLTESNFTRDSSILKKRLDDRNIQAKFREGQGRRVVTDYRGCEALSSFEVVPFMNTRWLVVAKMDKDEIVTQHYARHRAYYAAKLLTRLEEAPVVPFRNLNIPPASKTLRIDMDEFQWAKDGERLYTFGVSTCTGFLAVYPGRFGYMAHISPLDRIYGGDGVNILGRMVKRIESFDIFPSEKHSLLFIVVAPHAEVLPAIIDKLIEEGFLLSQILVLSNPQADSAAISYDYGQSDLHVRWRTKEQMLRVGHTLEDAGNVGGIIRQIMQLEEMG